MDTPNDGGSAFPSGDNDSPVAPFSPGMAMRDYFAAAALPACIDWLRRQERDRLLVGGEDPHAQPPLPDNPDDDDFMEAANAAYLFAEAMIRTRDNS